VRHDLFEELRGTVAIAALLGRKVNLADDARRFGIVERRAHIAHSIANERGADDSARDKLADHEQDVWL